MILCHIVSFGKLSRLVRKPILNKVPRYWIFQSPLCCELFFQRIYWVRFAIENQHSWETISNLPRLNSHVPRNIGQVSPEKFFVFLLVFGGAKKGHVCIYIYNYICILLESNFFIQAFYSIHVILETKAKFFGGSN